MYVGSMRQKFTYSGHEKEKEKESKGERYVHFRFEYVGRSCGLEPLRGFRVVYVRTE